MILKTAAILSFMVIEGAVAVAGSLERSDSSYTHHGLNVPHGYGFMDGTRYLQSERDLTVYCPAHSKGGNTKYKDILDTPVTNESCRNLSMSCFDCFSLVLCQKIDGYYKPLDCMKCPDYCDPDSNSCVEGRPLQCLPYKPCTSVGFFPYPLDCTKYFRCSSADGELTLTIGACDEDQVYKTNAFNGTGACVPREYPKECITVTCDGNNQILPYPGDPRFYLVCTGAYEAPYVFRCDDGENFVPETKTCY